MDRVNRRFLVASTLLALPVTLLMVSFSTGTAPEIQHAIELAGDDSHVQQVVGKQLETRATRPGLFQVITGKESRGSTNHQHQNMSKSEPKGLLDGFFDGSSKKKSTAKSTTHTHHNHTAHGNTAKSPANTAASKANSLRSSANNEVDWDGIPYHRVGETNSKQASAPTRDSSNNVDSASNGGTRIIRGGSARQIVATPASVRRSSAPSTPTELAQPVRAPQLAKPVQVATPQLSDSSSSRRSTRQSVETPPPAVVPPTKSATNHVAPTGDEPDLVPRVIRRKDVKEAAQPEATATVTKKPEPTPAPKAEPAPAKTEVAAKPTAQPTQPTAVTSIPLPATTTTTLSPTTTSATVVPTPAQNYTMPVDPATTPIPVAGLPTHPYAASTPAPTQQTTPALSVSHRSGPPADAFDAVSPTPPLYNSASAPVGSGVVPNGDVASYRRPTAQLSAPAESSQPIFQVAQRPANSYGQATIAQPELRPAHETAVPPQPIYQYQNLNPQPTAAAPSRAMADNFASPAFDNRNQMRDTHGGQRSGSATSTSELPGIRVNTFGPDSIMIRQTCQYEIRIENRGSIDATGVMVRALVPDWATLQGQNATRGNVDTEKQGSAPRLVWTIDQLPAGATESMFVSLTAAQSGTYNLDVDWTLLPQKSVARVQVREPKLEVNIEGPEQVIYGQSQTYKVRVLNPGDGIAPNVTFTLSPNSATPQMQRIGDIPPGKEAQFDVELTAQDLGDLNIHGLANGDLELRAESMKTIRVAAAQLEAVLTGPELKYQNTPASYNLQILNSGQATSDKIVAILRLPAGVEYLGGIDQANVQGKVLRWEINSLAPGASRDYQFGCTMTTTGEHQFAFECRGTAAGMAEVALATRVESISDLVLTITDPVAPAPIGSDVTYEITISNRGSKEANNVRAVAQFSHGIEPQRIEGQSGEVVTGQVLFDEIPRILAGQEVRLRVIAKAETAGHHRFRTEVRSGDTVLVAEEATHYMSPTSERVSRRSTNTVR